jgi:hypothetical protein
MRSATWLTSAAVFLLGALVLTGCETTRVNKRHAAFESVSDVTTTPHPDPHFASVSTGIPPVPASPTAAGSDGMQPLNDSEARRSPGSEKGMPMAAREQPQDRFIRQ